MHYAKTADIANLLAADPDALARVLTMALSALPTSAPPTPGLPMTTNELAARLRRSAAGIRNRLSKHGHYYGVTPATLPGGRLLWPADTVEQLLSLGSPVTARKRAEPRP
jgi:hypothetical protein